MIDFGGTLTKAREAKGLSITQISAMTRLMPQQIEDLENENFSKIPAPIYGRGFVKLYCEAVGLDPKPLVAEFMDIYSGNRQPIIRMRKPAASPAPAPQPPRVETPPPPPAPSPEPAPAPEPMPEREEFASAPQAQESPQSDLAFEPEKKEEPKVEEARQNLDLFEREIENEILNHEDDEPIGIRSASEMPTPANDFKLEQQSIKLADPFKATPETTETHTKPSRFLPPESKEKDFFYEDKFPFSIPPSVIRFGILAIGAILVMWLVCALISKVWRAATNDEGSPAATEEISQIVNEGENESKSPENSGEKPSNIKFGPKTNREQIEVPPLYIY